MQRMFFKCNLLFVLLTLQIYQGQAVYERTFNGSFHNSVDWSGLYLQIYIHSRFLKNLRLKFLDYWKMHF